MYILTCYMVLGFKTFWYFLFEGKHGLMMQQALRNEIILTNTITSSTTKRAIQINGHSRTRSLHLGVYFGESLFFDLGVAELG